MNLYGMTLVVGFALSMTVGVLAEDKKDVANKEKILGTWVGVEGPDPIKGAVITFAKDGKGRVAHKQDGKEVTVDIRYEIDGDVIKVTEKDKEGNEHLMKYKIKSLTEKEFVAESSKGEIAKFKKKAD